MKITYFGTAAAEGIPALFCNCSICEEAKETRGRNIRTRSQMLINEDQLIDFSADTYLHCLRDGLNLLKVKNLLVSHSHIDHFHPQDLITRNPGFSHGAEGILNIYGNAKVKQRFLNAIEMEGCTIEESLKFIEIDDYFSPFQSGDYTVTPLEASHDGRELCLIYQISDGTKTMLYGHDTGEITDKVWSYWKEKKSYFSFVTLDCTTQLHPCGHGHMSLADCVEVKERMIAEGHADDKTVFVVSHFSHNGGLNYADMCEAAEEFGFMVAHDGMSVEV